jgi:hypothetical protein
MAVILESFTEFSARQKVGGKPCPYVQANKISIRTGDTLGRFIFANGAVSDGLQSHFPPPDNEYDRLGIQRDYYAALLEGEEKAWHQYRQTCVDLAAQSARYANLPGCPPDAPQQLERGAQRIAELRQKVSEIDALLAGDPRKKVNNEAIERRQRAEAERIGQQNSLLNQLKAMGI